ncbi:MAG: segregation/condensation protein A, partial [Thermoanaerobaculia bacterium]
MHLPVFDGPLDLLLHLVRINKVEIADIPVAAVCDQFHQYLQLMDELNLDIAAEYVYEAALLIHLKSKLLLPRASSSRAEHDDPREDLVKRLLEFRRLKDAAQSLAEIHSVRRGIWTRPDQRPETETDSSGSLELGDVSLFDLLKSLQEVLKRYDYENPEPFRIRGESFDVKREFERLLERLDKARPYDLLTDLRARSCRGEAIAVFLAVLELARLNLVRLH